MNAADKDALIEALASSHRDVDPDGRIKHAPAFFDLDADGREAAHARALLSRQLEAALDPEGLSSTARRVLDFIRQSGA